MGNEHTMGKIISKDYSAKCCKNTTNQAVESMRVADGDGVYISTLRSGSSDSRFSL